MEIVSHAFWAATVAKAVNKKMKNPVHVWQGAFWGIFPDLLAFSLLFVWLFVQFIFGGLTISNLIPRFRQPGASQPAARMETSGEILPVFQWTSLLYNIGHSLVTFVLVFGILFLIFRRPIWEVCGWLFHILIDIPTHSYQYYPTPILWPFSGWKFRYGISWGTSLFLMINYIAIIVVYFFFWKKKKLKNYQGRLKLK
ncbi:MAG: hypothetical protein CO014_01705 [Candidatus Tagabacteria bacterium CG_4_8_14_3_um_filter_41_8]|uniref:Uncharacterized protein n=2 Tax=Candidatus Tagaibacteriota TaxID=1817918 RepID=A0A2M8G8U0_9BACT|nr:MAG: hypothetical protein COS58_00890 [Candidatus Tagabacteria bacterium CG03_land_8_20_14_0_80_41_22]PJC69778.1 MAG: hypothetical protein CO014_01705 [Candidatus Tagabacteria bacterium CG_4_8_14_3_um_filter_41_8]